MTYCYQTPSFTPMLGNRHPQSLLVKYESIIPFGICFDLSIIEIVKYEIFIVPHFTGFELQPICTNEL